MLPLFPVYLSAPTSPFAQHEHFISRLIVSNNDQTYCILRIYQIRHIQIVEYIGSIVLKYCS